MIKDTITSFSYLPHSDTGYFSGIVTDYLSYQKQLSPFYTYPPDIAGLDAAIRDRNNYPVDRKKLSQILTTQYAHLTQHEKVIENIALLKKDNTYTICTAHQPNLMTGYLYFVYKIIHAIKLAEELQTKYPDKHFVPVFYMGSEDNDLEELGTFRYGENKFVWDGNGQKGAVGRMNTESLKPLLNDFFKVLGPPNENCEELKRIITTAYFEHNTISAGIQYLINELFGRFGLVVLNPDERGLKESIIPIMQDDLLHQIAYAIVNKQLEQLSVHYKSQAAPRPINLFYLENQLRERIEKHGEIWQVLNTDIQFTETELIQELDAHPERFSPNVILRGLLQESILPNVAFIGGGAEVAYWLQLKTLFEHYNVFYPSIHLRQSILWIKQREAKLRNQLAFTDKDMFKSETTLTREYVTEHAGTDWQTSKEVETIENVLFQLKQKATSIDPTLKASAEAALAKMKHQLEILEKKMLRAEKRKMQIELSRITRLKETLFPNNNLQERVENFTDYFIQYGTTYFDVIKDATTPFNPTFLIIEDNFGA
jgi:bacillithiol biosynthesis cysteine-adding enzyme BshC